MKEYWAPAIAPKKRTARKAFKSEGKWGSKKTVDFRSLRPLRPVFRYSPMKAADEKIPLSVVDVNKKPQYIVFCWYSLNLISKCRHLPVESSKGPCLARVFAVDFAPESRQAEILAQLMFQGLSVDLYGLRHKAQNWCSLPAKLCELWTSGAKTGGRPA